jgi:hypothetical protein
MFRGAPITPTQWAWGDPFSEETAILDCPMITAWDTPGQADVSWLVHGSDVDIVWQPVAGSPVTAPWSWEGYIVSFDSGVDGSNSTFQIHLRGALYALDGFLAQPTFPAYPLPYEFLIRSAFDPEQHPCSLGPIDVAFPPDWNIVAETATPGENILLRPQGVITGSPWTGLVTRTTGSWNPLLTGYISSLLQVMWNADGSQWTIRNRGGRSPQLYVRQQAHDGDPSVLNVDLGAPGVTIQVTKDFSQSMQVVYGAGTDTTGTTFSGMQMSPDGTSTSYVPFAYNPAAYPHSGNGVINPQYNPQRKTQESFAQFQQGLTQLQAQQVAQGQLQRFNDPGLTGSITLTTDPYLSDGAFTTFLRVLIKAGQAIRVNGLFGVPGGVLFHISEVQVDFTGLSVSLTVDTKYRDMLTVDEVHARTRDPLALLHSLQATSQSNLVQDLLLPWSYADGSGCLPYASKTFFNTMPASEHFPYSNDLTVSGSGPGWCQQYPPSQYPEYYVRIGATDTQSSTGNWADFSSVTGTGQVAVPILMSQKGTAQQFQIAAYDINGNVMPVKFHVSLYQKNGVSVADMPAWGGNPFLNPPGTFPSILGPSDMANITSSYFARAWPSGSGTQPWSGVNSLTNVPYPQDGTTYHPMFAGAWQTTDEQGHVLYNGAGTGWVTTAPYAPNPGATGPGMVIGWGTYYVPAGFWPGQAGSSPISGMMVDTTPWSWDLTNSLNSQSPQPVIDAKDGPQNAGKLYAMIYCEDQGHQEVFFLGKVIAQAQNGG